MREVVVGCTRDRTIEFGQPGTPPRDAYTSQCGSGIVPNCTNLVKARARFFAGKNGLPPESGRKKSSHSGRDPGACWMATVPFGSRVDGQDLTGVDSMMPVL